MGRHEGRVAAESHSSALRRRFATVNAYKWYAHRGRNIGAGQSLTKPGSA